MVKPMRFEVSVPAGRLVEVPLQIRNTAGSEVRAIDLRPGGAVAEPDGSWRLVEGDARAAAPLFQPRLDVAQRDIGRHRAAAAGRGDAALRTRPPMPAAPISRRSSPRRPFPRTRPGLVVRVRFVIPVIVQIEGRPARQQVALKTRSWPSTTARTAARRPPPPALVITNDGRTYSRIDGRMTIERQSGDRWRPVTRFASGREADHPRHDAGARPRSRAAAAVGHLPPARRHLVDGRRVAPVEKEIDFQGDPTSTTLAYDTALILEPGVVEMEVVPGATRTTTLRIENPGEDPVQVQMRSRRPRGLIGVAIGRPARHRPVGRALDRDQAQRASPSAPACARTSAS